MKYIFGTLALALSLNAFATVDGNAKVYLVVANIQDDTEFFVERAPIIGCWGIVQGPQLAAWTREYKAISNIGCGGPTMYDNINALTCAKVTDSKESSGYDSISEITLDISACPQKDNPQFITMVRTSAKLNFPQRSGTEVKLTLVK